MKESSCNFFCSKTYDLRTNSSSASQKNPSANLVTSSILSFGASLWIMIFICIRHPHEIHCKKVLDLKQCECYCLQSKNISLLVVYNKILTRALVTVNIFVGLKKWVEINFEGVFWFFTRYFFKYKIDPKCFVKSRNMKLFCQLCKPNKNNSRLVICTKLVNQQRIGHRILAPLKKLWICLVLF